MRRAAFLIVVLMFAAGCATVEPTPQAGQVFRGEVWTWDDRTNVVTLLNGDVITRVRVSEETMRTLRKNQIVAIRGELAPPEEIAHVMTPPRPMIAVPRGEAQQAQITGNVLATDPKGLVSVDSANGAVKVWSATTDTSQFAQGAPVTVKITVQPVDMVASDAGSQPDPAASVVTEPGDFAVVTGKIVSVDPKGLITVESPRGPITVVVPNTGVLRAGSFVQVRTALHRAQ